MEIIVGILENEIIQLKTSTDIEQRKDGQVKWCVSWSGSLGRYSRNWIVISAESEIFKIHRRSSARLLGSRNSQVKRNTIKMNYKTYGAPIGISSDVLKTNLEDL